MKKHLFILAAIGAANASFAQVQYTFDAQAEKREIAGGKSTVRTSEKLSVLVKGANTFAYVYRLKGQSTDHFTSAVPAPLASIFLRSKAATSAIGKAGAPLKMAPDPLTGNSKPIQDEIIRLLDICGAIRGEAFTPIATEEESVVDDAFEGVLYSRKDGRVVSNTDIPALIIVKAAEVFGQAGDPITLVEKVEDALKHRQDFFEASAKKVQLQGDRVTRAVAVASGQDVELLKVKLSEATSSAAEALKLAAESLEEVGALQKRMARAKKIVKLAKEMATITVTGSGVAGSFLLGPITAGGDETTLQLTITPSEAYAKRIARPGVPVPEEEVTVSRAISVYGRRVLDFSAGLGWTPLRTQAYFKDSGNIVREGAHDEADVQFVVLGHWFTTNTPDAWSFSPTLGITASDKKLRLVGGVSFKMPGSTVRTYLTLGVAYGAVDRLNGMSVGQMVTGDIKTSSVIRSGLFVSLTTNFFGR